MKSLKKVLALAGVIVFTVFSVWWFASPGTQTAVESAETEQYTMWLYTAQDSAYYSDYAENPTLNYLLENTWGGKKVSIKFLVPPAGTQQDNYSTIITSGDFPDVMQNSVSDTAPVMYDNGYILDLTELVKEYMPNYAALLESNSELKSRSVFTVDGEEKILAINVVNEGVEPAYTGMVYRRDWIVKYGTNPSTGEAFTGGYLSDGVDDWEDDVVFPSWYDEEKKAKYLEMVPDWDGTTPAYISDWEWMFEIFSKAQEDQGITDSYCISVYYPGYTWAGGLCSCFGEGSVIWYKGSDGQVRFGGTEDSTRAYLDCMRNWYVKGWLDQDFNTRTQDLFFSIDNQGVRQGKVGIWQGLESDLGGRLDMNDGGWTEGIYVAGCAMPVNDVYGGEDCQYVKPRTLNIESSTVSTGFFLMKGAEEKDLGPLLSFFDYLYTDEGSVIRSLGLNAEQTAETGAAIYAEYGLEDGAYSIGEDGRYKLSEVISNDSGALRIAVTADKLPGIQLIDSVDKGYAATYEKSTGLWMQFENRGRLWGSVAMMNMSVEDADTAQSALTKVLEYMERTVYTYIKGETELDDAEWKKWCKTLARFKYDKVSDLIQPYVDLYWPGD